MLLVEDFLRRLQGRARHPDRNGTALINRPHHEQGLTKERFAMIGFKALHTKLTAVVNAKDDAVVYLELKVIISPRTAYSSRIHHLSVDEISIIATVIHRQARMIGGTGSLDGLRSHFPTLAARHHPHFSRMVGYTPTDMILMTVSLPPHALALPIDKELHLVSIVVIAP